VYAGACDVRQGGVAARLWATAILVGLASHAHAQSLDELLGLPDAAATQPAATQPAQLDADAQDTSGDDPLRRLTAAEAQDAYDAVIQHMTRAADALTGEAGAGLATQRLQEAALDRLDQIIASAEAVEQPSGGGGSGEEGSSSPRGAEAGRGGGSSGDASTPRGADAGQGEQPGDGSQPGGRGEGAGEGEEGLGGNGDGAGDSSPRDADPVEAMEQLRSAGWGHLPPRLREQVRQSLDEPMSPLYDRQTAEYWRALAELQEADDE
jgi:hypothetical protein